MTHTDCFWIGFVSGLIVGVGLGAMIMFVWRAM